MTLCDLWRVIRQTTSVLCSTPKWSVVLDTPSLEATKRLVVAPRHSPSWLMLVKQSGLVSCSQESFKVKFEANLQYIEEFIHINVTVTRCEKHL